MGHHSTGIDSKKEKEIEQMHAIEDAKLWGSSSTVHPGYCIYLYIYIYIYTIKDMKSFFDLYV
jgi:hypothetical protein